MNRQTALVLLNLGILCAVTPVVMAQQSAASLQRVSIISNTRSRHLATSVRIVPTTQPAGTTSIEVGSDSWVALGYDLKALLSEAYGVDARRIDLGDAANANGRYDVTLRLTGEETEDAVKHLLQTAMRQKFNLTVTPEARSMEVYVISSPNGPGPALHPHHASSRHNVAQSIDTDENVQRLSFEQQNCPGKTSGGISASMASIPAFSKTLETYLDRPIVNEASLPGIYDFKIGVYRSTDQLFQLLRDELGLVVTPAQRKIEVLAVASSKPATQVAMSGM